MNNLKEWLLGKLPELLPYKNSQYISGTQDFSIKFGTLNCKANPFNLTLKSKKKNNGDSDEDVIRYSLSCETPELHSVKRLRNTPFLISVLSYENSAIFIIDFYDWDPITSIYRIFYFQSLPEKDSIEIQLPKDFKKTASDVFKIRDYYFTVCCPSSINVVESTLKIPLLGDKNEGQVFTCSFSEKQPLSNDLSINSLLVKLNKIENVAGKYHILNNIRIQDRKKQLILDELWFTQKGINPDRQLNISQFNENLTTSDVLLWALELIYYMDWIDFNDDEIKKKYQTIFSEIPCNHRIFFDAYFNNNYEPNEIIDSLQSWWDQFSLPLYRIKFKKELKFNPSLIFVIYSLSLHLKLPWSQDLYQLSNYFSQEPQIAILAYLNQLMIIINDKQHTVKIIPGPEIAGNLKSLRRGKSDFRFTSFGNKYFTSLFQDNNKIFKIDKEVIIFFNEIKNDITVTPNIIPLEQHRFRKNIISIKLNDKKYHIPLVWKKAELSLPGCRFRWIFKKDRFQITCHPEKFLSSINIDEKLIDFNNKKITYYHPIGNSAKTVVIKLLDISGRSFLVNHELSKNTVQLIGWIQDRHGLLVDRYNIRLNSRQILCRSQGSGQLIHSFEIPMKIDRIEILSKKIYHNMTIKRIKNEVFRNLMLCSPYDGKSMFLAILNDNSKIRKKEIECLFLEFLGFIPFILYKSDIKKRLNKNDVVYIDQFDTLFKFENKTGFSKSSVLSLSYPKGIKNLFKILSGMLQTIE
jgi:hypothetical protein